MESSPVPFERLFAHRDWVRRVARALVADESRASDLEQQVWLAALEHPPREERSLRGWLGAVLRNGAAKMRRSEARRTLREESVPRSAAPPGPEEIVAETEAHERVVRAVLALEEPYRSTVLLRYFEDLAPGDVAARLGVPVETVRTRLRRALELVRTRLDGEHGSRRAWLILLLPLARTSPGSPTAPAVAGGAVAATIGGLLMGIAAKVAVAGAAIAAGCLLWTRPWEGASSSAGPVPAAEVISAAHQAGTAAGGGGGRPGPGGAKAGLQACAAVEVLTSRGIPIPGAFVRLLDPAGVAAPSTAATDSSGRVTLASAGAGRWNLRVEATGFAPSERSLWLRAGAAEPVRVVLRQGFPLVGTIRDAGGRPVVGAVVMADAGRVGVGGANSSSAPSGTDGRYRLEGLGAGLLELSVRTGAGILHQEGKIRVPGVSLLDLLILGGVAVRGRVVDDGTGKGLSGAAVAVEILQGGTPFSGMGTARTGEDGRFAVEDLPPGDIGVRIRVTRDGYRTWPPRESREPAFRGSVLVGSAREKEIRLVPGVDPSPFGPEEPAAAAAPGSIEGIVVDAAGAPAAGVTVSLWSESKPSGPPLETVTGHDGRFQRDGVPAGRGSLYARPSGEGVGSSIAFVLEGGGALHGLRIELKRGAVISGRVRRGDGKPVEGPALWAAIGSFSPGSEGAPEMLARDDQEVRVSPDGSFHLENLRAGKWFLAAGAEGCSMAATILEVAEGESKADVELVVDPLLELAGRVVSGDGSPVAGARVRAWSDSERSARGALFTVTGEDGGFRGTGLRGGPVHLQVEADGFRSLEREVAAGERELVLALETAMTLSGRVAEKGTGKPLAGVPVRASPEGGTDGRPRPRGTWEAVTGGDGTFVIEKVAEGMWTVTAGAGRGGIPSDWLPETLKGVASGATGIEFALGRGESLAGRLVDDSGAPYTDPMLIGVQRRPADERGGGGGGGSGETRSSDDGSFLVRGLDAGEYDLRLRASSGRGDATSPSVLVKGVRTGGEPLVVTIPRGVRIRGRVENLPGPVVRGKGGWILLRATGEENWPRMSCYPEADGTFRSEPLDPTRTYDLLARDFPGRMGSLVGVRPGESEVVLSLSAGLSLSGRVVDGEGAPVGAGVPVNAWAKKEGADEPGARASTATRPDGTFLLTGLGSHAFGISAGGGESEFLTAYAGEEADGGITPGAADLVLTVRRGLTRTWKLLDASGKPVAGVKVETVGNGDTQRTAYTGEDGSFVLRGLAAGTVKLRVEERILGPFDVATEDLEVRLPAR